jgi:dihydrofolate reductase
MIGIIAAVSRNGVLGLDNKIPWNYPADMRYFRETTKGSNIIMGRRTFESIGKPLPKRRNIVISSTKMEMVGVETYPSIMRALDNIETKTSYQQEANGIIQIIPADTWFCGGARIYEEGMDYADEIHLTVTPDIIRDGGAVRFPMINPRHWEVKSWQQLTPGNDTLRVYVYKRIA